MMVYYNVLIKLLTVIRFYDIIKLTKEIRTTVWKL